MPQMLGYHTKKKKVCANTFNWHFCILDSNADSLLQLIVQFVSSLISVCIYFLGLTLWGLELVHFDTTRPKKVLISEVFPCLSIASS